MENRLKRNFVHFMKNLRVDNQLCAYMEQESQFYGGNVSDIMAHPAGQNRNAEFLKIVSGRGEPALRCFWEALKNTAQTDLANKLQIAATPARTPARGNRYPGVADGPEEVPDILKVYRYFEPNIPINIVGVEQGGNLMQRVKNKAEAMKTTLLGYANNEAVLRECDVFVLCVMSHGEEGIVLGSDGEHVNIQKDIIDPFHSRRCPGLDGKPKVVLIQACQGSHEMACAPRIDGSIQQHTSPDAAAETFTWDSDSKKLSMNIDRDMLVACSTCSGYVSFRETKCGSWFIRAFIMEMQNYCHEKHISEILTKVVQSVGDCRACATIDNLDTTQLIQMPFFSSSLKRSLFLLVPTE